MKDPWFPDYVAQWYDEFCTNEPYADLDQWRLNGTTLIDTWKPMLVKDPHSAAVRLDEFIRSGSYRDLSNHERRFHALTIASSVINEMGFRRVKRSGGSPWKMLRKHWQRNGNLLRDIPGYLLPREPPLEYPWSWNYSPQGHSVESYFRDVVRWDPSKHLNYTIRVSVLPVNTVPVPSLDGPLRIAVVPLVESIKDFHLDIDDDNPDFARFSMSLKSPEVIGVAALKALDSCAEQKCDIVVFPELCLTPQIQESLGERLRTLGKYPWLVVAGSARTPVPGDSGTAHYNQAVVFGSQGKQLLSHHKLHRYSMDYEQQDRYGVLEALKEVNRTEDMEVKPYEIEVIETPIGRLAILICEDLVVETMVDPLVIKLGLDWLLVPVLDGCQTGTRWPAKFGLKYADRGACVVVATSLSLVQQHMLSMRAAPLLPGVGLVVVPGLIKDRVKILESSRHDEPAFWDLPQP
jgi:predicted amidohydrolase